MASNFLRWLGVTLGAAVVAWVVLYCVGTILLYVSGGVVFGPSSDQPAFKVSHD